MPIQGLLQKANLLQSEGLAFFDFITKHKIKYCAFFKRFSLHYAITNSFGLDSESIINSLSTVDFWNGTIPCSNKVYKSSNQDGSINTFLQLFSAELKDQIKLISILKFEDNSIFLIINSDITQDMISDLKNLNLENYKRSEKNTLSKFLPEVEIKKYTVTFDSFIENYLKVTGADEKYNSVFFNAINKEIQLRLYNSFKDYSCIKCLESNKYEIQIQETHSLPLNLLKTHIISILNDIISIEEDNISLIEA